MNKLFLMATLMLAGFANAAKPIRTLVPVDAVYAPIGFDNNDNSEVIVSGFLPNLCYKSPFTKVRARGNTVEIVAGALKETDANSFCPEVLVPFVETVRLGVVAKGVYKISVNKGTSFSANTKLRVSQSATNAIDDYLYANVESLEKDYDKGILKLKGYNPSDCVVLDEVKIISNKKDTYSILPKMKVISNDCPMKMMPFEYKVRVPKSLKVDKVLLHVRVMNGKSLNTVYDYNF